MGPDISLHLGSLASYFEDLARRTFGTDAETLDWNARLSRRTRLAAEQAKWVQCVGMAQPIRIENIYQPIDVESFGRSVTIQNLLEASTSSIIFAGPGFGKSTLLNRLYVDLLSRTEFIPYLFVLRSPNATEDLTEFVQRLTSRKKTSRKGRLVLLVDGYDEVSREDRVAISSALADFKAAEVGMFFVTCREFYDVYELKVPHYTLKSFEHQHQIGFIMAFCSNYQKPIDPEALLRQLKQRNLLEFARHPLLLTLICILESGPFPELPTNSISLLKRVFDTLTLRWDQQKGVLRESTVPLDGEDRVRCLMRVAYRMTDLVVKQEQVEGFAREFLTLAQRKHVDAREMLREVAQWYGVLVPTSDNMWQFVHRSIHDYLAARFWVESGTFNPKTVREWNSRSAYAACLSPDATESITRALKSESEVHVVSECLLNKAPFDVVEVAHALLFRFSRFKPFVMTRSPGELRVECSENIFRLASEEFLMAILDCALDGEAMGSQARSSAATETVIAYSLFQIHQRGAEIRDDKLWRRALHLFARADFQFSIGIDDPSRFLLSDVFKRPN
jgi:hypothetical protein